MDPENEGAPAFTFDESVAGVGDEILNKMPDVQEHAVAAHEAKTAEAEATAERDSDGTPFDAALHTGTKLKDGTWRKRKTPGTPGSFVAAPRARTSSAKSAAPAVDPNAEAIATGTVIATLFLGACQSIGGEEWEPAQHERDFQTSAWQAYCVAKGMKELSPGLALSVAIGSYAMPRFTKPKTAARVGRVKTWIALRVARYKLRKELAKRGITAKVEIVEGALLIDGKDPAETLK